MAHSPLSPPFWTGLHQIQGASTAAYSAVLDAHGEMMFAVGDMDILSELTWEHVSEFEGNISKAKMVVLDGNVPQDVASKLCTLCKSCGVPGRCFHPLLYLWAITLFCSM
jgi:pseudouridine kinase